MTVLTGNPKYVIIKLDLLKVFWQTPLTKRAKEVSAFVAHDGPGRREVGRRNKVPALAE